MAQYKNTVERRKAEGKCTGCGLTPPEKGRVKCLPCLLKSREKNKKWIRCLKRDGICIQCATSLAMPEKTLCIGCSQAARDVRKSNKDNRLCSSCGQVNEHSFFVTCNTCRNVANDGKIRRRDERISKKICTNCRKEHEGKYKNCEVCLDRRRKNHSREKKQGICPKCKCEVFTGRVHCDDCLELERFRNKTAAVKLKQLVMDSYGGKCVCCHESNIVYLNIDHINNDGAVDRRNGLKGSDMYRYLRDHDWPSGFQVLCFNCNLAKHYQGYCSHEKKDDKNKTVLGDSRDYRYNVYFTDVAVLTGGWTAGREFSDY